MAFAMEVYRPRPLLHATLRAQGATVNASKPQGATFTGIRHCRFTAAVLAPVTLLLRGRTRRNRAATTTSTTTTTTNSGTARVSPSASEPKGSSDGGAKAGSLSFLDLSRLLRPYFWPTTGTRREVSMNRLRAVLTWLCVIGSKASSILAPMYLASAMDIMSPALMTGRGYLTAKIVWPVFAYAFLIFSSKMLRELQSLLYIKVKQAAYIEIADTTFVHLHSLSLDWHREKRMGSIVKAMDRGIQAAQRTMEYIFLYLLPAIGESVAVILIFMLRFHTPYLGLFLLSQLLLYAGVTVGITIWRKQFRETATKRDDEVNGRLIDSLLNYETVKHFAAEDYEREQYRASVKQYQQASMATQASLSLLNVLQQLIVSFATFGGMALSAASVLQGGGTLGTFIAVNTYIVTVFAPFAFLGTIYNMSVDALVDMRSFAGMLAEKPSVADPPGKARALNLEGGDPTVPMIEFRNVSFGYEKQAEGRQLRNVSFQVPQGSSLALVGTSGSGKTTITRLLSRFYDPSGGQVLINGQDISTVSQRSVRSSIGMVPQDIVLFNASVAHNIRYGRLSGAKDEDVRGAAADAQLADFISQQAAGYETMVGERGLLLSGGEKQRLAIARCILKDPPIVVLDEATSALDSETEARVQRALEVLSKSRTVVAIAHRLSSIKNFQQIIVLEDGQVVERGTHEELLATESRYSRMWRQQESGSRMD